MYGYFKEILFGIVGVCVASIGFYQSNDPNIDIFQSTVLSVCGTVLASIVAAMVYAEISNRKKLNSEISLVHNHIQNALTQIDYTITEQNSTPQEKINQIQVSVEGLITSSADLAKICGKQAEEMIGGFREDRQTFQQISEDMRGFKNEVNLVVDKILDQEPIKAGLTDDEVDNEGSERAELAEHIEEMFSNFEQKLSSEIKANSRAPASETPTRVPPVNKSKKVQVENAPQTSVDMILAQMRRLNMQHVGNPMQRIVCHALFDIVSNYPEPITRAEIRDAAENIPELKKAVELGNLSRTKINGILSIFVRGGAFNEMKTGDDEPAKFELKKAFREKLYFLTIHDATILVLDVTKRLSENDYKELLITNTTDPEVLDKKIVNFVHKKLSPA